MRLSELVIIGECPLKATLKFKLKASGSTKLKNRIERTREIFLDKNIKTISEMKESKFEDKMFDSEKEKEAYIKSVLVKIDRFTVNMNEYDGIEIVKNRGGSIDIGKNKIYLSADMIFEKKSIVFISKIIDSEAKIKN